MNIIVVGSGIAGLFAAYQEKRRYPNAQVVVVEREDSFGGLLKSKHYPDVGAFDYGTHMIFETFDEEVDKFLFMAASSLPIKELSGDWAGNYWNKSLNLNSSQVDITSLDREHYKSIVGETMGLLSTTTSGNTAAEYFLSRFGTTALNHVFSPILKKTFNEEAEALHHSACHIFPLSRLIAFDVPTMLGLMSSISLRAKFGFPDQFVLPTEYVTKRRGIYPAKIGLGAYVNALVLCLEKMGVQFYKNVHDLGLKFSGHGLTEVSFSHQNKSLEFSSVEKCVWSAGIPAFYFSHFNPTGRNHVLKKGQSTVIANLVVRKRPELDKCHYIYNFDKSHLSYRITNYSAFTESDISHGLYKLTVELLLSEQFDSKQLTDQLMRELSELRLIDHPSEVEFIAYEQIGVGIPLLSVANVLTLQKIRTAFSEAKSLSNICFVGAGSSDNLFFQSDILKDVKLKLTNWK